MLAEELFNPAKRVNFCFLCLFNYAYLEKPSNLLYLSGSFV